MVPRTNYFLARPNAETCKLYNLCWVFYIDGAKITPAEGWIMSQLTWRYERMQYRASAVSELGTYRVQGGPNQRWVAFFLPFASVEASTLSDVFAACNFATLNEAVRACRDHAERCVKICS